MSLHPPHHRSLRHPAPARRGSVYVLVLGASLLVSVVGLGAVLLSRTSIRATTTSRDWSEAGIAAQSGIEYAVAVMNTFSTWRTDATSGGPIGPIGIGRARVMVTLVDETDGNLSNDSTQPVRIYSVATVGAATRCYSAQAALISTAGLDVLRCPVHTAGNITSSGNAVVTLGPLSSAGTLSNSASLTSDVEANSVTSSGFILGYVRTGMPAKTMPDATAWNALIGSATAISYGSLGGGKFDKDILTPGLNTATSSTNAAGVYSINVPLLSTLTIRRSRLQATLLVALGIGSSLVVQDENLWDPGSSNLPTLIVQGSLGSSVTLGGSSTSAPLSEVTLSTNYNPSGAPYNSVTDSDRLDTYPCELHGVFHILSNIPTTLGTNIKMIGTLVSAGNVTINTPATLTASPTLLSSPPIGYSDPAHSAMAVVPGTYRWEVAGVNAAVTP